MSRTLFASVVSILFTSINIAFSQSAQPLPFNQNWNNTGMITTANVWSGVPGIIGYRGDDITTTTGVDPQTLLTEGTVVVNVLANQINPNTNSTGGVAEFEITDPVIALQGSGTADAPNIIIALNTLCQNNLSISYNLRDIDGSTDNSVQPVALQYRIGTTGNFTNIPAAFVADASSGPSLATLVSAVNVALPTACNNQAVVQLRIITANAVGNDEWIGIDDISITGTNTAPTSAVISGNGEICIGENISDVPVFVTITGGQSPFTVVYSNGTSNTTVNNYTSGSALSETINVTTTYTLVSVTDANGCAVGAANLSGSALVTVNQCGSCDLTSSGLTEVHCENNNESNSGTDDYIWFQLNPTGINLGSGYDVFVSSGNILLDGVTPATNVPYGISSFFRLQSGSAGSGNVTLTVTDNTTGSACLIQEVIIDPGSCSGSETTYFISDPCVCNNNASFLGNDGTFSEEITVNAPPFGTVTAICTGCVGYNGFIEVTPGTYVANFSHVDNQGYTADISYNNSFIGSISNICAYPDVVIDAQGPFQNCAGQTGVPLTADISGDTGTGVYNWTGSGVTGTTFNPSSLPASQVLITLSYTGENNGNISLNGITPAYPGCVQSDTAYFVVNNGAPVNAGPGGSTCPNAPFQLNATGNGSWSGGSGTYSNANSANATYTPGINEAGTIVVLTWTALGACLPNTDTLQVNVLQFPNINAGMNMNVCFGPVMLTGSSNAPGTWSGGAGSFTSPTNPMTTYTPAMTEQGQTSTLTYTATNSCGSTNASVMVTFSINEAEFYYNPNLICTGGAPLSPQHNTGINGVYTATPISGGTISINSQTGTINPALSTPGTYKITNTVTPVGTGGGPALILTGILDGPLTGGIPKAIELYAINAIPDLSVYGVENASNGAPSAGIPDFVFPAGSVAAGTFIYISSEAPGFLAWFGFNANYINGVANNNGDDAIILYANGSPIDVYGVVGVDGTGQPWESLDGWAHRNSGSCPTSVFNNVQWSYSGINAWDDDLTNINATATPPYPAGMFSAGMCSGASQCTSVFMDTVTIRQTPTLDAGPGKVSCGTNVVSLSGTGQGSWSGGLGSFSNINIPTPNYTPNTSEVGHNIYLYYSVLDQLCGAVKDSTSITFIAPPASAEFSYQSAEFCPNGTNPTVSHTIGINGIYTVSMGNASNVALNKLTGEIDLDNTIPGTYEITNTVSACGSLIITGIVDGPLVGGQPKAVELYAIEDIPNIDVYGLGVANNGGGSDGEEYQFPTGFVAKGSYIYVTTNAVDFNSFFGFSPNYVSNDVQLNGDDAVELYCNGQVIDIFGEIFHNGINLPWDYLDGWVYRKNNANITGNYFNVNDWTYSGINALDNETSNGTSVHPFPIRTFTTNALPMCPPNKFKRSIFIGDNKPPVVVCPQNYYVDLSAGECGTTVFLPEPTVVDNCGGEPTIVQTQGPVSGSFFTKNNSPYDIVINVFDFYGNGPVTCAYKVFIVPYPFPTTSLTCNSKVNISADASCEVNFNADIFLEGGPYGCYDDYEVYLWPFNSEANSTGNVSGQVLDMTGWSGSHTYKVVDPITGNTCWGTFVIEDKLAPTIECSDITINCITPVPTAPIVIDYSKLTLAQGAVNTGTLQYTKTFPLTGIVTDVNLAINMSFGGFDESISLVSPSGTQLVVWPPSLSGCPTLNCIGRQSRSSATFRCMCGFQCRGQCKFKFIFCGLRLSGLRGFQCI